MRITATLLVAIALLGSAAAAGARSAPEAAQAIERRLDGAVMITTAGDGIYRVYERIDDPAGLSGTDEVVCLIRNDCYVLIARLPEAALSRSGAGLEQPLRRIAEARRKAERATDAEKPLAERAWRDAIGALQACLATEGGC